MINVDIDLIRGEGYSSILSALDTSGNAFNLSGYFLTGMARFRYDTSGCLLSFSPYSPNQTSGLVNVNLTPSLTSGSPIGSYYYGIDAYNNTERTTLFQGFMNVSPNVFFVTHDPEVLLNVVEQLTCGHGAPSGVPPVTGNASIYYDLDNFQMYLWNPNTQSW